MNTSSRAQLIDAQTFSGICGDALSRPRAELAAWGSENVSDAQPEVSTAASDDGRRRHSASLTSGARRVAHETGLYEP